MRFVILSSGLMVNLESIMYITKVIELGKERLKLTGRTIDLVLSEQETEELRRYISDYGIGNGFTRSAARL